MTASPGNGPTTTKSLPRAFWQLTLARGLSTFASNMLAIVLGWRIYYLTHSTLALGFAGLAEAVPAIGLALWAGLLVDRGEPLQLFRRAISLHLLAVLLPAAGLFLPAESHALAPVGLLYAAGVVVGMARSLYQPCLFAIVPRIVPPAQLPQATSSGSAAMQVARVLGPATGGLLYGHSGPGVALAVAGACFVVSLLALGPIVLTAATAAAPRRAPRGRALFEGARYVLATPVMLAALSLDMICVLFGSATAVLPAFAEAVLTAGPTALGWLRAAPALGAVFGSLLLTRLNVQRRAGQALLLAVAGYGLCMLIFALSHTLWLSFAVLLVSGLLDSVSVLVRQLIVQLMSPNALRGRISAVNAMFIGSSNELGEFESGLMAWWLGLVPSVVAGSLLCLAFVLLVSLRSRPLRQLNLATLAPPA